MRNGGALRTLALAALVSATAGAGCGKRPGPAEVADTIFINGGIYTVDAERSWAQAAAVRGGRIVAIGSNEEIQALKGPATTVVDLTGRMALPGFHDSHVHVAWSGFQEMQCAINDLETIEAILDAVKECAARTKDEWIVGGGWWESLFDHRGPRKELLDQAVPGRAVILASVDEHSSWVSSRALELAGITAKTPDPENGVIERDARTGEPTGTLRETAMDVVMDKAPEPSAEMRLEGLRRGLRHVSRFGITSFIEAAAEDADFDAFETVARSGELTAKVRLSLDLPDLQVARASRICSPVGRNCRDRD